jgi:hypothetical protein
VNEERGTLLVIWHLGRSAPSILASRTGAGNCRSPVRSGA